MRLAPSQSKNKLYVGNVPKLWSPEKWEAELKKIVKGEHHHHGNSRHPALYPRAQCETKPSILHPKPQGLWGLQA